MYKVPYLIRSISWDYLKMTIGKECYVLWEVAFRLAKELLKNRAMSSDFNLCLVPLFPATQKELL